MTAIIPYDLSGNSGTILVTKKSGSYSQHISLCGSSWVWDYFEASQNNYTAPENCWDFIYGTFLDIAKPGSRKEPDLV